MASRRALRRADGWDPAAAQDERQAPAPDAPVGKPRAKKDTKRWCKGKEGREHIVVLAENQWPEECGWRAFRVLKAGTKHQWYCHHVLRCSVCLKVLTHPWGMEPEACPDYTPLPAGLLQ